MTDSIRPRPRPSLRFPDRIRRSRGREMNGTVEQRVEVPDAPTPRISVAIMHHNEILREGLSLLLAQQADFNVVASSGANLAVVRDAKPDVVLLALGSQSAESIRDAKTALAAISPLRVIVIAPLGALAAFGSLEQAGAYAFVLDDASSEELLRTIRSVADGAHVWPPATVQALLSQVTSENAKRDSLAPARISHMTPREREVIALITDGLSTKEMARQLGIACFTVRAHVRNVLEKLHLHSRLQIAAHVHRERSLNGSMGNEDQVAQAM